MNKYLGVTIGDIDGIGIEILISLFKKKKINNFILFSNIKIVSEILKKENIQIKKINNIEVDFKKNKKNNYIYIYDYLSKNKIENTYKSLSECYNFVKKNNLRGIITLPLNKEKILRKIDKNFIGQTEFYKKIDNKKNSHMIFIKNKLIITPLTTHIKFNNIIKKLSINNFVFNSVKSLNQVLIKQLNIKKPKIIISGLNPHAGENGYLGKEEIRFINKDVKKLQKLNINISGPYPADSMLLNNNMSKFNCFIFIYHDQALIPFKLLSNYNGINFTGGLSVPRVSPDHGTAYNLVGKNNAKETSLLKCFNFIKMKK